MIRGLLVAKIVKETQPLGFYSSIPVWRGGSVDKKDVDGVICSLLSILSF